MSDKNNINFIITDYKKENVLSSYTLEQTPLLFIPDIVEQNFTKILWNFGDGTTSDQISATKWYNTPGNYTVSMVLYDCFLNSSESTIKKTVTISEYIPHTFKIEFEDPNLYDSVVWKNGRINGPIKFKATNPIGRPPSNIYYSVSSNNNSTNYYKINKEPFSHLSGYHSIFEQKYNYYLKSPQFVEIPKIDLTYKEIYAKIQNNDIIISTKNDESSFLVGLSAEKNLYFKNDFVGDSIISFFFDKNQIENNENKIYNNLNISLSAKIIENDEISKLNITSNGLDGEYYPIKSFDIYPIKYSNVGISFTIKVKDLSGFSVKNFENLPLSSFNISILSSGNPLNSNYYDISEVSQYKGAVRGKLKFKTDNKIESVSISASSTLTNNENTTFHISGESNLFDVLIRDSIKLNKKNEDFDMTESYKNMRFQEFLMDDTVLFDDLLRSIVGDINSSHDTLGKKIHEKISNFNINHVDIDKCETNSLISHMEMLNSDNLSYDKFSMSSPEEIVRLINFGSINKSKLFGYKNKYNQNFDLKGRVSKEIYGKNLGNELDVMTYTISSGIDIVALEKFSNKYTLLNTEQPLWVLDTNTYKLSSYSSSWGWPLVLPDTFEPEDIEKYYSFFEYVSSYENNIVDYIIIDDDSYKNITNKNYLSSYGYETDVEISKKYIIETKMIEMLYDSLSLYEN